MPEIDASEELAAEQLASLKSRADLLGVKYHPSIGAESLREKIKAAMADKPAEPVASPPPEASAGAAAPVVESAGAKRKRLRDEAAKLVRIRLTCMNPLKKEHDGEIITAGNSAVGSFKKYIPFNGADDGWHVPNIIYQVLKDRMCPQYYTEKSKHGVSIRKSRLIREFAIELLPDLTQSELDELARRQAMAKSVD